MEYIRKKIEKQKYDINIIIKQRLNYDFLRAFSTKTGCAAGKL